MKCLKVDEYIKRTASVKETELLRLELQVGWFTILTKTNCLFSVQLE